MTMEYVEPDSFSPDETWVRDCARNGRVADFRTRSGEASKPVVSAQALHDIYLELDNNQTRGKAGLRVRHATVTGVLDLSGTAGQGGMALPGLALEACDIEGVIDVTDAHIYSLVLTGSRMAGLEGRGVIIDGELDFQRVRPRHDDGTCYINIRSGRLNGNIYGQSAHLVGRDADPSDENSRTEFRYALRLTESRIAGSVYLTDGVYARGGAVIRNSTVAGNVWADGARMVAADGYAFSVQGSRIDGGLRLSFSTKDKHGFTAVGCVCARMATINGSIRLDGGAFTASADAARLAEAKGGLAGADRAIDMERVVVRGDVSFGVPSDTYAKSRLETRVTGDMSLAGASIGGDLCWSNLKIVEQEISDRPEAGDEGGAERQRTLINLEAVKVERRLRAHDLDDIADDVTIRLRAAEVHLLQDVWRGAPAPLFPWGSSNVGLEMDGFVYALSSSRDVNTRQHINDLNRRFKKSSSFWERRWIQWQIAVAQLSERWAGLLAFALRHHASPATHRLRWLERLYPRGWLGRRQINRRTFRSQPYAQAAAAFAAVGFDSDARKVQLQQLRLIRRTGRWLRVPDRRLYDLLFGYGISPWRAMRTLIAAFLIGWFGVSRANSGGMLELVVQPTQVVGSESIVEVVNTDLPPVPCGGEINDALFALDVFIPLVDLRQDSECEIPEEPIADTVLERSNLQTNPLEPWRLGPVVIPLDNPDFWRVARAVYALLGWILISLSILTFSGILRRQS